MLQSHNYVAQPYDHRHNGREDKFLLDMQATNSGH